jgi:hypothetical protein
VGGYPHIPSHTIVKWQETSSDENVEHHIVDFRREDTMSVWWMPRRCVPMKDVAKRRYAWGSRLQALIPRSPNGATPQPCAVTVFGRREPGELNHLMYPEEEKVSP